MGFGKNKSEQGTTFDPQLKNALLSVFQEGRNLYNTMPYVGYDSARTAPMSNIEMAGMQGTVDAAQSGIGRQEVADAMAGARQAMQYQPLSVRSGSFGARDSTARSFGARDSTARSFGARDVGASSYGARDTTASDFGARDIGNQSASRDVRQLGPSRSVYADQVGPLDQVGRGIFNPLALISEERVREPGGVLADQVQAERIRDTSLSPYENVYEDTVVQNTLGDIERARQMQQNRNAASAVSGGAFGGDRHAIVEAETNKAALEQAAKTAGALRQSGYEAAAQRAEGDVSRNLTAQQSNQGANLTADQFTRGQQLTTDQLNQAANLQRQTQNISNLMAQDRDIYGAQVQNVGNELARQRANQEANLRGDLANQSSDTAYRDAALRADMANQSQDQSLREAQLRADSANQAADLTRGQSYADQLLNSQRFNQQADLQRGQSWVDQLQNAQRYNQQADLTRGQATQDAMLRASLANQSTDVARGQSYTDQLLRSSIANQQADLTRGQAGLDSYMQAQLANQAADQAGAQFRLGAGDNLANLGQTMRGLNFADAGAITGVGRDQRDYAQGLFDDQYGRYMDEREWPFRMFDVLRGAAGILPNPTTQYGSSSGWQFQGSA